MADNTDQKMSRIRKLYKEYYWDETIELEVFLDLLHFEVSE